MPENNYSLKITPLASADLDNVYNYIAYTFYAENTALKAIDEIEAGLKRLKKLPYSAPSWDEPQYAGFGLRKLVIAPYIVYYVVNGDKKQVEIIRVLHGLMDAVKAMKDITED